MNNQTNKILKKFCSWLLILSVINLFIISLTPWISVENDSKEKVYYNFLTMEDSENIQINNVANYLFYIIILLWIIIIISSIFYISFSIYYVSEGYLRFARIMINTGYVAIAINILITSLIINLIRKITEMDGISLASIYLNINFVYIPLIIGFLSLIISIIYTYYIVFNVLKQKELLKSGKKQTYEALSINNPKKIVKKELFPENIVSDFNVDIKQIKSSEWLKSEKVQKIGLEIKSEPDAPEIKDYIEEEKSLENEEEDIKFKKSEEKIILEPFPSEKIKEKIKRSDELQTSQQFEQALSSAIEKNQGKMRSQIPSETLFETEHEHIKKITPQTEIQNEMQENLSINEKKDLKKKIHVRCPQCKFIFQFEQSENFTNIKCPKCGKEGVIKYPKELIRYPPQF